MSYGEGRSMEVKESKSCPICGDYLDTEPGGFTWTGDTCSKECARTFQLKREIAWAGDAVCDRLLEVARAVWEPKYPDRR
jgi:hypothetical protein